MSIRRAEQADVAAMAAIRAAEWETQAYWERRIAGYIAASVNPQHALAARAVFVAVDGDELAGFVAGHLTRRFGCTGELEWINVALSHRGTEVAAELLHAMATWFVDHGGTHVCVDAEPSNAVARGFYAKHGAVELNPHWLVWPDIGVLLPSRLE